MAAYGKHLLVDLANGDSVHVHLGMRGKWLRFAPVTGPGLPQVRLRLAVPEAESRRVDKRETCYDCGTAIVTGTIVGRTTYACPRCQSEWAG